MNKEEQVWEALREANLACGYVFSEEEFRKMRIMFMAGHFVGQVFTQIRERCESMGEQLSEINQKQQEIFNIINEACLANCLAAGEIDED